MTGALNRRVTKPWSVTNGNLASIDGTVVDTALRGTLVCCSVILRFHKNGMRWNPGTKADTMAVIIDISSEIRDQSARCWATIISDADVLVVCELESI